MSYWLYPGYILAYVSSCIAYLAQDLIKRLCNHQEERKTVLSIKVVML